MVLLLSDVAANFEKLLGVVNPEKLFDRSERKKSKNFMFLFTYNKIRTAAVTFNVQKYSNIMTKCSFSKKHF